jgi:deoxyribodipyrimidine photolyase-like uncharacterized protein
MEDFYRGRSRRHDVLMDGDRPVGGRCFLDNRLGAFGPHEDAMLRDERWLAHSLLSPCLDLGLLDPLDVVGRTGSSTATPSPTGTPASQQR